MIERLVRPRSRKKSDGVHIYMHAVAFFPGARPDKTK